MVCLGDFQWARETELGVEEGMAQVSLWIRWMEDKIQTLLEDEK